MTQAQTRHRSTRPHTPRPSRIRLGWIVTTCAFLLVAAAAGYWAYGWQRERNTLRLLRHARAAQQQGDFDAAIESYGVYLQRAESDVEALREYADLLHDRLAASRNWLGPTLRALRQLNRLDPNDVETIGRATGTLFGLCTSIAGTCRAH